MKLERNKLGFSAVELIIAAVIVAALVFVGYTIYSRQQDKSAQQSPTATDVSSAPEIKDGNDLDEALRVLDQNDPATGSNTDSVQLDSELSTF